MYLVQLTVIIIGGYLNFDRVRDDLLVAFGDLVGVVVVDEVGGLLGDPLLVEVEGRPQEDEQGDYYRHYTIKGNTRKA